MGVQCSVLTKRAGITATSQDLQLLQFGLFPATTTDPQTTAMFEVLHLFQILTFGSKVSGYEFYQALVRLTNNLGGPVPVSGHPQSLVSI